jgi:hypothetical protein
VVKTPKQAKLTTGIWSEIEAIKARLVAESPLKSPTAKDSLAETMAIMVVRQRYLAQRDVDGTLDRDTARTLPAIASAILRLALRLQVAVDAEKVVPNDL